MRGWKALELTFAEPRVRGWKALELTFAEPRVKGWTALELTFAEPRVKEWKALELTGPQSRCACLSSGPLGHSCHPPAPGATSGAGFWCDSSVSALPALSLTGELCALYLPPWAIRALRFCYKCKMSPTHVRTAPGPLPPTQKEDLRLLNLPPREQWTATQHACINRILPTLLFLARIG